MTPPPPDAVVFDFDGTIFDSETPIYRASAAALAEMGLTLTIPGWATVVGHGEDDSYRAMCAAVGANLAREKLAIGSPDWVYRISGSRPTLPMRITLLTDAMGLVPCS